MGTDWFVVSATTSSADVSHRALSRVDVLHGVCDGAVVNVHDCITPSINGDTMTVLLLLWLAYVHGWLPLWVAVVLTVGRVFLAGLRLLAAYDQR